MLRRLLDVRPEERRPTAIAFLVLFGILAAHTILEDFFPFLLDATPLARCRGRNSRRGARTRRGRPDRRLRRQRRDGDGFSGVDTERCAEPDRDNLRTRPRAARL